MAEEVNEFRRTIERICAGSREAIYEFIDQYGPHIQRAVRRRLNHGLRTKYDSTDFVQMVWASLFADLQKIADMREPEQLILHLVGIARNKVIDETRHRMKYERYNVARERPLTSQDLSAPRSVKNHETPSQQLMAKERLQQMIRGSSRRDRRIVEMRLRGATFTEIAKAIGMHERTVRQIVGDMEHAATG